jgi:hypothetical protein
MKSRKTQIAENALRSYIRQEIHKLLEADEEAPVTEPKPEPKKKPEPEEEEGLNPDFASAVSEYIRKLKDSTEPVEQSDLIDMVSTIIERFAASSEEKLTVLKAIRSNIVH